MLRSLFICVCFISVGPFQTLKAQQPLNLGFELISTEGPTRPWGWTPLSYAPGATVLVDSSVAYTGRRSLRISQGDEEPDQSLYTHSLATYLNPIAAGGKQVRVTGWIMTENLEGHALFTVQAWANYEILRVDSTHSQKALESSFPTQWTQHQVEIYIPPETETLVITVDMQGMGSVWFDELSLEIEGEPFRSLPIARNISDSEVQWLARHSFPLHTVDPSPLRSNSDLSDLDVLSPIIGEARIIALGESSHGTSEFFRLKHRVLEYLIRHHGFRLFAMEDQQLEMEKVNAYVRGGSGTIEEAMSGMFGVWATTEVKDLIEWLKEYNVEHSHDPVEFVGFDMQNPTLPIDSLFAFAKRYDPNLYPTLVSLLWDYRKAWQRNAYPQYLVSDSVRHRWADGAEAAWRLVKARRTAWLSRAESKMDSLDVEWAQQNARVAAQAGRYIFNHQPDRDSSMALNLKWHLDRRGSDERVVLWAHDSHISKGQASTTEGNYFLSSMGFYLNQLYGKDDYKSFGIMSYEGTYTATRSMWGGPRDLILVDAFPAPSGSLEEAFHRVSQRLETACFVMDLRPATSDSEGKMLLEQRPYRFVGYAAEDYGFSGSIEAVHQFDGIFFIDRTTGTRPLRISPWPPESN